MNVRILLKALGGVLSFLGIIILAPALFSTYNRLPSAGPFFLTSLIMICFGSALFVSQRNHHAEFLHRTGFAVVTFAWLFAAVFGALPYYLAGTFSSYLDCFFESISGFTGTGSTVLTDIESLDQGLLLWRSMTQWLGGMGIVVFFIAILPALGIRSVSLFRAEVTGPHKDRVTPRIKDTARNLWRIYIGLTLLLALLLRLAGMPSFDAICHSMTALATGGFSTKNAGIAFYHNAAIEYILALFMLIASINFSLHFRLLARGDLTIFRDTELRWYLALTVAFIVMCVALTIDVTYDSFWDSLRHSVFTVTATASSTGFTNSNYQLWTGPTHLLIILMMVMGGMSGSTAGGTKCVRMIVAMKQMLRELKLAVHPSAVVPVKVNQKSVSDDMLNAIWAFLFLYLFVFSLIVAVLSFDGVGLIEAASGTFSALSNIGPGLGGLGPVENYAWLQDSSKLALCAGMLFGRLEFFTVLVIVTPTYWRR